MAEKSISRLTELRKLIYTDIAKTTKSTPPIRPKPLSEQRTPYRSRG